MSDIHNDTHVKEVQNIDNDNYLQPNTPSEPILLSTNNQPSDNPSQPKIWQFQFFGQGAAYFKIWIVNACLTLITLGVYSPWAKVRTLRYFYGQTQLNQRRFDFVGEPKRILAGRLIAIFIYFLFYISGTLSESIFVIGSIAIFLIIPWILRSSMRFMANNSKYSNRRFVFTGKLAEIYVIVIIGAILSMLTFGLLFPAVWLWYKRYQLDNLNFAGMQMKLNVSVGSVYKAVILPTIAMFVTGAILGILIAALQHNSGDNVFSTTAVYFIFFIFLFYLLSLFFTPFILGHLKKLIWSNTTIGNNVFQTTLNPVHYAWISVTNTIATIFTLGLFYPWAKIRLSKYELSCLSLHVYDNPSVLEKVADNQESALGEELADIFDIDVSL